MIKIKKFKTSNEDSAFGLQVVELSDKNGNTITINIDLTDFANMAAALIQVNGKTIFSKRIIK